LATLGKSLAELKTKALKQPWQLDLVVRIRA